jgi:hypothetical protein
VSTQQPPQQPGWGPPPPRPERGAAPPPQPPKPSPWRNWAILGVVVLSLFIIGRVTNKDQPEPTSTPATTAQATSGTTAQPEATAEPETTAEPVKVTSEQLLHDAVAKELGDSNPNLERLPEFSAHKGEYIVLQWAINENLTEGLTKTAPGWTR